MTGSTGGDLGARFGTCEEDGIVNMMGSAGGTEVGTVDTNEEQGSLEKYDGDEGDDISNGGCEKD